MNLIEKPVLRNYFRREIPSRICRSILLQHLTQHKQIAVPCIVIKHWNPIIFQDRIKEKKNWERFHGLVLH